MVKTFRNTRILQIGPRPFDFWSVIVNEGELLEKFGIQLSPIPLGELTSYMKGLIENADPRIEETKQVYRKWCDVQITDEDFTKVAALKLAMGDKMDQYGCNAGTIQCWTELQAEIGILLYASEALLQTEGRPVTCEVDINGAISELLAESATLGEEKALFADVNCRHPENENGELLQHLGTFAFQTAKDRPVLPPSHFVFDYPGSAAFGIKDGTYTLVRFDGDHGDYSMLVGNAKTCEGPYEQGTYAWFEFKDLNRFEAKYVYGPYIHHMVGVRADVVPILAEAGKYLGVKADYFDPIADKVDAYWYGDSNTILDENQK